MLELSRGIFSGMAFPEGSYPYITLSHLFPLYCLED